MNNIKTKNGKLPKVFKEKVDESIEVNINSANKKEVLNSIETSLNKILAELNKKIIFDEFIIATLEDDKHVLFYSVKDEVSDWFAKSKDEFTDEFKEENVKNLDLVYCDKIDHGKSTFKSNNIGDILNEVKKTDNKYKALRNEGLFPGAKFIKFSIDSRSYIYDIVNDKIFIIKYYNTIENYFILEEVGAKFGYHCLNSNGQYASWDIGENNYELAGAEEINVFREKFLKGD